MQIQQMRECDWPADFDLNDLPLFAIALAELRWTHQTALVEANLSGKIMWFLLSLLPGYVESHRKELSKQEYDALRDVYFRQEDWRWEAFPSWE